MAESRDVLKRGIGLSHQAAYSLENALMTATVQVGTILIEQRPAIAQSGSAERALLSQLGSSPDPRWLGS
jgi:hypothetical protein